ncbi:cytochrome c oxidase subunit II [Acidobacteria bacterium AH-259-O06]|nr:cytochrome c oxidase subunit II [Acidobacteria bacterium AH-259-O06]
MLLAISIWIITIITVILFAGRYWWFPESASAHGAILDEQFEITLIVTGLVFILAQLGLGYFVFRYRERPGRTAYYSHGSNKAEVAWTVATTVLFFAMVLLGYQVWVDLYIQEAPEDVIQIEVMGQQFAWNIRYPGPDGQFGNTRPELINDAAGNPVGLDFEDPAAKDDLVVPTMAVPINRPVELLLRSKDVTHSFSVRELRLKQDTIPGMIIPLRFTATRMGKYEIACAELCGLGHHRMRSFLDVLSDEDYAQWLKEQSEF